ncbi:MAG TPA: hypothetical protein VNE38_04915 [Ktedonobacteraceae bacterium]|nr:hypothetical protein [Ktedonobacteraceae bacterium]
MRVAALALVLIIASAVVLIFANTLNSWVLGGLIGGLAALLISIPISLIIFATLARRNDERLYAQMVLQREEDQVYDQREYDDRDDYDEYPRYSEVYEAETYYFSADEEEYKAPRGRRQSELRSLPAAGQSYASSSAARMAASQRATPPQATRRVTRDLVSDRERNREALPSRNLQQTGHQRNARSPYTTRSMRSQQQSAALRAAQQEAAQDQQRGSEQISTGPMRRPTTTRHLPPQSTQLHRSQLQEEVARKNAAEARRARYNLSSGPNNPSSGPIRLNPETDQITRDPQLDELLRGGDALTGNLRNPLVRRAPYLYEDDALREEFSQQIDQPITRRASRYLHLEEEER